MIVQFGGQTPLNLARALSEAGVTIIGTSVDTIDAAEDREQFQQLLNKVGLKQPANGIARTMDEARKQVATRRLSRVGASKFCFGRSSDGDLL